MKIDLNAPAFSTKVETESTVETSTTIPQVEEKIEQEEQKVPYSRFETMRQRAKEAEEEADRFRKLAERPHTEFTESTEMTPEWVELYGDTDASKKAYAIEQKRIAKYTEEIAQKAEERARLAYREEREQESKKQESNIDTLNERLEDLSDFLGRKITSKEENDLLDIIDDYTPKDVDGNYAGELLSMNKAWEIYEMKKAHDPSRKSRNAVASVIGTKSEGEPTDTKEFIPGWGNWRNRV